MWWPAAAPALRGFHPVSGYGLRDASSFAFPPVIGDDRLRAARGEEYFSLCWVRHQCRHEASSPPQRRKNLAPDRLLMAFWQFKSVVALIMASLTQELQLSLRMNGGSWISSSVTEVLYAPAQCCLSGSLPHIWFQGCWDYHQSNYCNEIIISMVYLRLDCSSICCLCQWCTNPQRLVVEAESMVH